METVIQLVLLIVANAQMIQLVLNVIQHINCSLMELLYVNLVQILQMLSVMALTQLLVIVDSSFQIMHALVVQITVLLVQMQPTARNVTLIIIYMMILVMNVPLVKFAKIIKHQSHVM